MSAQNQLAEIYNFRRLDENLGTAGQPTQTQFQAIHDAGYHVVVNLALATSDNAIPSEGGLVTGLGMSYVHIPVNFQNPAAEDFQAFRQILEAFEGRRIFVHCAANMRVSAFLFLYRVLHKAMPIAQAEKEMHAIWQPDEVWSRFIETELRRGGVR